MIFPCEEDDPVRPHFEESGEEFRDTELECEEEEAREPCVLRGDFKSGSPIIRVTINGQPDVDWPILLYTIVVIVIDT